MKIDLNINRSAGDRVRRLREERGWSQGRLARAVGRTQASISRLETGTDNWTLRALADVAKALGVPVSALHAGGGAEPVGLSYGPAYLETGCGVSVELVSLGATFYGRVDLRLGAQGLFPVVRCPLERLHGVGEVNGWYEVRRGGEVVDQEADRRAAELTAFRLDLSAGAVELALPQTPHRGIRLLPWSGGVR